jgi:hypothetical protein
MSLVLTIDGLGKRYGMLPSAILAQSNTFDLYIMDAAMSFENYHHKKSMNDGTAPAPDYSEDEMLDIINKIKDNN